MSEPIDLDHLIESIEMTDALLPIRQSDANDIMSVTLSVARELKQTRAKLDFLKSKGLTVGMLKEAGKAERLSYHIETGSELCDLATVNKLTDALAELAAQRQRSETAERERESVIRYVTQDPDGAIDPSLSLLDDFVIPAMREQERIQDQLTADLASAVAARDAMAEQLQAYKDHPLEEDYRRRTEFQQRVEGERDALAAEVERLREDRGEDQATIAALESELKDRERDVDYLKRELAKGNEDSNPFMSR